MGNAIRPTVSVSWTRGYRTAFSDVLRHSPKVFAGCQLVNNFFAEFYDRDRIGALVLALSDFAESYGLAVESFTRGWQEQGARNLDRT